MPCGGHSVQTVTGQKPEVFIRMTGASLRVVTASMPGCGDLCQHPLMMVILVTTTNSCQSPWPRQPQLHDSLCRQSGQGVIMRVTSQKLACVACIPSNNDVRLDVCIKHATTSLIAIIKVDQAISCGW